MVDYYNINFILSKKKNKTATNLYTVHCKVTACSESNKSAVTA